jgi:hypothetical protein
MSARINGITNTNNDVNIENNMKVLPLVREEYYLTLEAFNKLSRDISFIGNDISFNANISISGDLIPLGNSISDLGSSTNYWSNAYINNLNVNNFVNTIDASYLTDNTITSAKIASNTIVDDDISLNAEIAFSKINTTNAIMDSDISSNASIAFSKINTTNAIMDTDISANANISGYKIANASIASSKIDSSGTWSFTNISISGNIIPLNNVVSDLGSSSNYWRHAYIDNIDVSSHIRIGQGHFGGKILPSSSEHEIIIDPHGYDFPYTGTDASGAVIILGDLIVRGNSTTITSSNIDISDLALHIASNATINTVYGTESGIELGSDKYASLLYNGVSNSWRTNIGLEISGAITLSGNLVSSSNNSQLGSSNKYWSNAYITNLNVTNFVNTIDASYLTDNTITSAKIANGTIVNNDISSNAQIEFSKINASNAIMNSDISTNASIAFSKIDASLAITNSHIATNADISGSKIANTSIASSKIDSSGTWRFLNISANFGNIYDLSVNNAMTISGNLIPLNSNNNSTLGSTTNLWRNAYIQDISVENISVSGNLTTDISNFRITTTHRVYQNIREDISWNAVNGYYGLAKDAYPSLNPLSSGVLSVSSWTSRTSANEANGWSNVCWSPELRIFVAVASEGNNNRVMTSPDGIRWSLTSQSIELNYWSSVCWSSELGLFVAVATIGTTNNRVMTSANGKSWTGISQGIDITSFWRAVCWSSELGIFVAVASSGNNRVMTSSNGISWTSISGGVELNGWSAVCWSSELGIFVAVASVGNNRVMTSHNGINWTGRLSTNEENSWKSVCWSSELGIFVAVADRGTSKLPYAGTNKVMTSHNGITWTGRVSANENNEWWSVCWSKELMLFVSVAEKGETNRVMTSPDGISWTSISGGLDNNAWQSVCWSSELGLFVAVAFDGINRVMTSSLKGRPPTSYNVFDSSFNSIDENGNWTFSNINTTTISISGNIVPLNNNNSDLGSTTNLWRNAYIQDISASNMSISGSISVSGNIVPSNNNNSNLGLSESRWNNLYISSIDVSGDISNIRQIIPQIANDISTSLGTSSNIWQRAFISDLSGITRINGATWPLTTGGGGGTSDFSGLDINTNLIPRNPLSIDIGSSSKYWRNAYIQDISASNISISGNIIFSVSGGSMRIASDASNNSITTTHRLYQNISGDISWNAVNGYYGLAKDAYPSLNPQSNGELAVRTWTGRRSSNESNGWGGVCWSPELRLFVAVAQSGSIRVMTSPDGITWSGITSAGEGRPWYNVCWSPQLRLFVAVGSTIMTSPNGITWTIKTAQTVNGICWSPELGIFVAVSELDMTMTSSDGTTWTPQTVPDENNYWTSVCWSKELGIFVAVAWLGTNRVMTSPDGINWTRRVSANETNGWRCVCWSGELGLFIAVANAGGSDRIMSSSDGITWNKIKFFSGLTSVCWSSELRLFVAVSDFYTFRVITSPNGVTWTERIASANENSWKGVCWSKELGIFVAVSIFGTNRVMTSSLKGRPPTSYNIFDSSFNSIDESGNWTFSNISVSGNIVPLNSNNSSDLGLITSRWNNLFVRNIDISGDISNVRDICNVRQIVPQIANDISTSLGTSSNIWQRAFISDLSGITRINGATWPLTTGGGGGTSDYLRLILWADSVISTDNGQLTRIYRYERVLYNPNNMIINNNNLSTAAIRMPFTGNYIISIGGQGGFAGSSANGQTRIVGSGKDIYMNASTAVSSGTSTLNVNMDRIWEVSYFFTCVENDTLSLFRATNHRINPQDTAQISSALNDENNGTYRRLGQVKVWYLGSGGGGGGGGGTSDFSGLDISTSLIPRNTLSIDLGSSSKYWRNAYIQDISAINTNTTKINAHDISVNNNMTVSGNLTITNTSSSINVQSTINNLLSRISSLEEKAQRLVFWSDQTIAAAHNTLSIIINYSYIWVNDLTLVNNNTTNAGLILPYNGIYIFGIIGWNCGVGEGNARVEVYRNSVKVFDRRRGACSMFDNSIIFNQALAGDFVQCSRHSNNTGAILTGTGYISTHGDQLGYVKIWYLGTGIVSQTTEANTIINSLSTRINLLEQTAVIRSFDTLVGSPTRVSNFTIPVDLVNNESVEIDLNIILIGNNLVNLKVGINSAGLTNQDFDEYNGILREGSNSSVSNTAFNKATYGAGVVLVNLETQGLTSVIRMKLYRTHNLNDNFSRFQFESKAVYCRAGIGVATLETVGMINDLLPTGLYFYLPNSNTTMTASYSIINDKRRTVLDGALS